MDKWQGQITEVINRNEFVTVALRAGYNVYLPVYDRGVDLILHHLSRNDTRLVQLKSRWTISARYRDRDIWIAFPYEGSWYLVPHDEMLQHAGEIGVALNTASWTKGSYSSKHLSAAMLARCAKHAFPDHPMPELSMAHEDEVA